LRVEQVIPVRLVAVVEAIRTVVAASGGIVVGPDENNATVLADGLVAEIRRENVGGWH
jgi:hypothetical protein